jgi:predicted nuclease of predicted toxin-antitoxin system
LKFKVDENLPSEVTAALRSALHDAESVLDEALGGVDDREVARVCREEGRILVTLDLGFGDIRLYRPGEHAGIVVLRLRSQEMSHIERTVQRLLGVLAAEPVAGAIWIVEETRVRVRG